MRKANSYSVYLILSAASTLFNAMMFTYLTVYYVQNAKMNPFQLVLVGTVAEITSFGFEIPTGVVADTYSRRLSVIVGTLITGAAFLFVGLVPSFPAIATGLAIWAIGATFISGAREAWITDEVGEERVGSVFLHTAQIRQVAALAGIFVSAGLAEVDVRLPIVTGAGLTIVLAAYLLFAMPETHARPSVQGETQSWLTMWKMLRDGLGLVARSSLLRWFLIAGIAFGACEEAFGRLGEAHFLIDFHFPALGDFKPVVWFGIIAAGVRIFSFIATGAARRWLNMKSSTAMAWGLTMLCLLRVCCIVAFGLTGNFFLALGAYWGAMMAGQVLQPIYITLINLHIDMRLRATVLSMLGQADALGQIAGGPAIGAIGSIYSLRAAMVAAGAVLSPVFLLSWRLLRRNKKVPAPIEVADTPLQSEETTL